MTEMLDLAVEKLAKLPGSEQDRMARWILEELPDEELWDKQFSESQTALSKLAAAARKERQAGQTTELDLDRL